MVDKGTLRVIATIPCHNEESYIGDVVARSLRHADAVIVVDDGSTDDTACNAEANGASVVRHRTNQGPGAAAATCFSAALELGGDVVVTLDGDGQHNPDEIPLLSAPIIEGQADIVVGSRFLDSRCAVPLYRRFGIGVITYLYNLGARMTLRDSQSCFRAYSRRILEEIPLTERGFGFSVEILIKARRRGYRIVEVPISCVYHQDSHSLNPVYHGLAVALKVLRLRLRRDRKKPAQAKL
jgi:glycosyltransferase involved in cell wall biosynthesis